MELEELEYSIAKSITSEEIDLLLQALADDGNIDAIEHYCHLVTIMGCEKRASARITVLLLEY